MTVYAININSLQCRPFATEREMNSCGNIWHGFRSAEDLENKMVGLGLTINKMATIYNKVSEKEVKKFSDKKTAAKRVFNAISDQVMTVDEVVENLKGTPEGDLISAVAKKTQTTFVRLANPRNTFEGKLIKVLEEKNLRKSSGRGYSSYEVLLKHGADMPYELYIENGGRKEDLSWDIKKGWVEVYDA